MERLNKYQIYLLLILTLAFILRLLGVDFGLPYIYHTDEWFEVKRALKLGAGIIDFNRVGKGGYFYVLFVEYGIFFVILKLFGIVKSADDFLYKFFLDPTQLWLIGRVTTVFIGTLNCFLVYLLGKRVFSARAGLFASLLLAINTIHVQSSHYITVDVPQTTLLTLCFIVMFAPGEEERTFTHFHYALLGALSALAIMTKITAAPVLISVLAFHFGNIKKERGKVAFRAYFFDRRMLWFSIICPLVYLLGEPGMLYQFKGIAKMIFSFFTASRGKAGGGKELLWPIIPESRSLLSYYLGTLFPVKYLVVCLAFVGGLLVSLKEKRGKNLVFLSFFIPYLFFLSSSKRPELMFPRYLLPILPIVFIYAGYCIDFLLRTFDYRFRYGKAVVAAILIVGLFPMAQDSIAFCREFSKPDTRTMAKKWVEENIPPDSVIYINGGIVSASTMTVPLEMDPDRIDEVFEKYMSGLSMNETKNRFYELKKESLRGKKTFKLILTGNDLWLRDALKKREGDYAILLSDTFYRFSFEINRKNFPEMNRLISWVKSGDFTLIKVFEPDEKKTGPAIMIFKRIG